MAAVPLLLSKERLEILLKNVIDQGVFRIARSVRAGAGGAFSRLAVRMAQHGLRLWT
jgi:hypothetical protein